MGATDAAALGGGVGGVWVLSLTGRSWSLAGQGVEKVEWLEVVWKGAF